MNDFKDGDIVVYKFGRFQRFVGVYRRVEFRDKSDYMMISTYVEFEPPIDRFGVMVSASGICNTQGIRHATEYEEFLHYLHGSSCLIKGDDEVSAE